MGVCIWEAVHECLGHGESRVGACWERLLNVKRGHDGLSQLPGDAIEGGTVRNTGGNGAMDVLSRFLRVDDHYRRQIAMDLHDEVTARLAAVAFSMETLLSTTPSMPQGVIERLTQYRVELLDVLQWARLKSHELHPDLLSHLGLCEGVRRLATGWGARVGVPVEVHITDGEVDPSVSATLYRAVQECLRNIEKHAEATAVTVSVTMDAQWIEIVVTDNGKGFSVSDEYRTVSGIGLVGMSGCLGMLQGTCRIDSSPGGGTRVELAAPRQRLLIGP